MEWCDVIAVTSDGANVAFELKDSDKTLLIPGNHVPHQTVLLALCRIIINDRFYDAHCPPPGRASRPKPDS
jgi:hypothetical protein